MTDSTDQVITNAVEQVFKALSAAIDTKNARARALADSRQKLRELTRAAERIVAVLPGHSRRAMQQRLNMIRARGRRGYTPAEDVRARAVGAFLRSRKGAPFCPQDLMKWLKVRHIACPDPRYAARTLARKAKQGVVRRVGYGWYRVV